MVKNNMITLKKLKDFQYHIANFKNGVSKGVMISEEDADDLAEIIRKEIKEQEELDQMDADQTRAEELKAEAAYEEKI